ncbi:uncharacterized protein LOC116774021 isoform X2 [Danaus plexippus]|uniref:uncharacterized protein LOC116774021 isoform X2 n=1 Tax=Danaus plexippus TaxID=13037 RepID=UPI002AB105D2|nr:uncharacterized protein LOC116774021 isoform X2 [Danaus plexippus]
MEEWESDSIVEQWILEHDHTFMPLPSIELNPHLLISKVRKHYMEYLIKLLSVNYETNQKLLNKNIYLPSAIWRCAKIIEMSAAQTAMVVNLYRKNIMNVELKKTTKNGLLYKKLYECLHFQPQNEKKTQTHSKVDDTCNCKCVCSLKKKIKKSSQSPKSSYYPESIGIENPQIALKTGSHTEAQLPNQNCNTSILSENLKTEPKESDDLMLQMEKLFEGNPNDDDIFDSALCDSSSINNTEEMTALNDLQVNTSMPIDALQENQASCPNDRSLLSGMPVNIEPGSQYTRTKNNRVSKWLCEEYFMKIKLYELLDQIRDSDRKRLARIKQKFEELFGDVSDDEDMVSPLDESPELIMSCKERITPWVVKILTPYYVNGRIRGKALFKALAKHLIKLIYQCSKFPYDYEVENFIKDFLNNHRMIRCEADFKQFKIENV